MNNRFINTNLIIVTTIALLTNISAPSTPTQANTASNDGGAATSESQVPVSKELVRRAIGHAEGNFTVSGKKTKLYYGHTDPGNEVANQGWCSDQRRGKGNLDRANRECDKYVFSRWARIEKDMKAAGLDLAKYPEAFINALDLWNQASPWVSKQFPTKYAQARRDGKQGETALVWARVEAFRRNGRIDASGLLGICAREKRGLSPWDCVAADQRRRVRAINRTLSTRK